MPFAPPANITETGNGTNLYALASEINIFPDPLIIDNLVVMNQATVENLAVVTESISLSSTLGTNVLNVVNDNLQFNGQPLIKPSLTSNYVYTNGPIGAIDGTLTLDRVNNKISISYKTYDLSGNSYLSKPFFTYLFSLIDALQFPTIVFSNVVDYFVLTLTSYNNSLTFTDFNYTGTVPSSINDGVQFTVCLPSYNVEIPPASDVTNWSLYPSINNEILPNPTLTSSDFNIGSSTVGLNLNLNSNQDVVLNADRGISLNANVDGLSGQSYMNLLDVGHIQYLDRGDSILGTALIELRAKGGTYGDIEIIADPTDPTSLGVQNGGLINIQANSGTGATPLNLSRVNIEAATVSMSAGALGTLVAVPASVNLLCGVGSGIQILTGVGVINSAAGGSNTVSGGLGVYLNGASAGVNVAGGDLYISNGNKLRADEINTFTTDGPLSIITTGAGDLTLASSSGGGTGKIILNSAGQGTVISDYVQFNSLYDGSTYGTVGQVLTSISGDKFAWANSTSGSSGLNGYIQFSDGSGGFASSSFLTTNIGGDVVTNSIKPKGLVDKITSYGTSGQIPVANGGANFDWEWKTPAASTNVQGKFGSTTAALALTGAYQNMATQTFTTLNAAAPLLVWGTLNVFNTGLIDAVISVRLLINGTGGLVQTKTIAGQHYESITCLGGGTGPTPAGVFNVSIQALITTGAATRVNASVITNAQFVLSA